MKAVIAGGTGFLGTYLVKTLVQSGYRVILLSRGSKKVNLAPKDQVETVFWDGRSLGEWVSCLEGADAVINLCGEGIADKRWSREQKVKLRSSRLDSTCAIVLAIEKCTLKPKALINASAVGFYGSVPEGEVDESHQRAHGFLADLCADWEEAALEAKRFGVRVVLPRIGIVLEEKKGALAKMIPPFQWGIGGPLGSGKQWFPWVHIQDLVEMILFSIQRTDLEGPFNACSPNPVSMKDFCASLGKVLHRPSWAPVPGFVLRILLGEMASMLLGGQRAIPKKMLEIGFRFRYPVLEPALLSILAPSVTA